MIKPSSIKKMFHAFKAQTLIALLTLTVPCVLSAQTPKGPQENQRLSQYLLTLKPDQRNFLFATTWVTPESKLAQESLHRSLLLAVSDVPSSLQIETLSPQERKNWQGWLNREKPVGRIRLPSTDARWLEANPQSDPILKSTHRIHVPNRPAHVSLLKNDGTLCQVKFAANRPAQDYAKTCSENKLPADWAYVIQPDGEIQRFGISLWNQSAQDPPAPGAWIWIPARSYRWTTEFNDQLIRFLSGQGVSEPADPIKDLESLKTEVHHYKDLHVSASDWGVAGLLQTPTARFFESGHGLISFSHTSPYTWANVILTPFDWLEAGFRYVDINNRLYGSSIAGSQNLKDKSIDAKFRLVEEDRHIPQVAIGLRDLGGTGLFSGEYVVANKRFGAIDLSLGLGWGYVGARGNMSNPLGFLGDKFKTRPQSATSSQGGAFNTNTYFRGPTALFGGIQYQTTLPGLTLKFEVDGNNYQNEPQDNNQPQNSPLNLGLVYRLSSHTQLSLGYERGNKVMLGVTFGTNLGKISTPKVNEPRPLPIAGFNGDQPVVKELTQESWAQLIQTLQLQTGWSIGSIQKRNNTLRVEVLSTPTLDWAAITDRANRVLHRYASKEIVRFTYVIHERGLPIQELSIDRDEWLAKVSSFVPETIRLYQPRVQDEPIDRQPVRPSVIDQAMIKNTRESFSSGLGVSYAQSLGGPDAFILFQLSAEAELEWRPMENTWVTATGKLGLIDNYDKFKYTASSKLPRVRTYIREFVTSKDATIPLFQLTHTKKLSDNWSASLYGGILEMMYAGVGGELLYRPFKGNVALGFDVNHVKQRAFEQDFSLRDYKVTTGHATVYWDTNWQDILAKVSAGRYLAADHGVTVDLSRKFANGVRIGAFATKTNVSAEDFGEGSFDKGIYVTIPFDAMMTKYSKAEANLLWRPLTRDGGAKLNRRFELYDLTRMGSN